MSYPDTRLFIDGQWQDAKGGRTLAVHMYALSSEGLYTGQAYATAVVLLVVVAGINALSAALAKRIARG